MTITTEVYRNDAWVEASPNAGEKYREVYPDGMVITHGSYSAPDANAEARSWRDDELRRSDWIVPLTDHPERASYLTYREALRNWPSTDDFPDTKPIL